jgi:3-dehydroquinate synthase
LLSLGAGRDSALVAVGGGVTGDLAGFVAATWHRGIPVVQVPTSLLSMADAALGGKTAINVGAGKNFVGAFHQPLGVHADVSVLSTLAEERYVEGFAEVVKSAVVGDAKLFRWLEKNVEPLLARDTEALEYAIGQCMRIKGRVVSGDERESGRRAILNFGHTIAHALEVHSGYSIHHGHAVAVGMCVEARIARGRTGLSEAHVARVERLIESFGLPTRPSFEVTAADLIASTRHDKKARAGRVHYALPREAGRMLPGDDVTVAVDDASVERIWLEFLG